MSTKKKSTCTGQKLTSESNAGLKCGKVVQFCHPKIITASSVKLACLSFEPVDKFDQVILPSFAPQEEGLRQPQFALSRRGFLKSQHQEQQRAVEIASTKQRARAEGRAKLPLTQFDRGRLGRDARDRPVSALHSHPVPL